MFHQFGTITNTKGDSLPGWQVECVQLSDGSTVVPIYADESSTPIVSVSGVANRAVADADGNYDFFVLDGTYSLRFYNAAGVYQKMQRYVPMTGIDGLTTDLASNDGAAMIGTATGVTVQEALNDLVAGQTPECYIVPVIGQSLSIGRASQITAPTAIPVGLYMPVGGCEFPSVNSPAPLSSSSRPISPANFASFVPLVQTSGVETLAPGLGYQLTTGGISKVIYFATGLGGTSIGQHLAGGGAGGGASGPFFANLQSFLYNAVAWVRANGYRPIIKPIYIQGHSDADQLDDGGNATTETTQAQYLSALTKLKRDVNMACSLALGEPWNETLWVTPLLTGGAAGPTYTLAGRKQVVAAQLQAAQGSVRGIKLLPPHSQFATLFTEGDLVHPNGQGFRYYGELAGACILNPTITPPYIVSTSVLSGTQVKVTFDQTVAIDSTLAEATTSGVFAGLEAYTAGGSQLPLTAASVSGRDVTVTMASTATFSKIRNGLAQETSGTYVKMPRTRIRGTTAVGTAQDGTVLYSFSIPQEI